MLHFYIALAYFLSGEFGLMMAIPPGFSSVIWPASGLALFAILRFGRRAAFGVFVGHFAVNLSIGMNVESTELLMKSILVAACIAVGGVTQAGLAKWWLKKVMPWPNPLHDLKAILKFVVICGPLCCLVASTLGVTVLSLAGVMSTGRLFNWATWWVGDTLGVLIFTPILLSFWGEPRAFWEEKKYRLGMPLMLAFAVSATFFFVMKSSIERDFENQWVKQVDALEDSWRLSLNQSDLKKTFQFLDSEAQQLSIVLFQLDGDELLEIYRRSDHLNFNWMEERRIETDLGVFVLKASPNLQYQLSQANWTNWGILIFALLFTSWLGIFFLVLTGRHQAVQEIVEIKTKALNDEIKRCKIYEEELEEKTQIAESAIRVKSEFLANMTHEIKTPINGITGVCSILKEEAKTEDEQKLADLLERSTVQLKRIVEDILDYSQLEEGGLKIEHSVFDFEWLLKACEQRFRGEAQSKGVELNFSFLQQGEDKYIESDPRRLQQILDHLVSNAVKFTEVGSVSVESKVISHRHGDLLQIRVVDTGIGMSEEDLALVFKSFSQVDGSMLRKVGGAGLGLSISQKLSHLLGGDMSVSSELNEGTTVSVSIPVKVGLRSKLKPAAEECLSME